MTTANSSVPNIPCGCNWNFSLARTRRTSFKKQFKLSKQIKMKTSVKTLLSVFGVMLVVNAHAKLNVVATTWDFGAIAQAIGGDKIDLLTLARPTEDPHFVDAKPSYIVKL